jgi:hypothetical protein
MRLEIFRPDHSWQAAGVVVDGYEVRVIEEVNSPGYALVKDVLYWDKCWRSRGGLSFESRLFLWPGGEELLVTDDRGFEFALIRPTEPVNLDVEDGYLRLMNEYGGDSLAIYDKLWRPSGVPGTLPGFPRGQSRTLVIGPYDFQVAYHGGFYREPDYIAPGRRERRSPLAERVV